MSSNSGAQQRPELPATLTSTAPSPQHPLQQSTANSRPTPPPSSQPLQQTELSDNDLSLILNALSSISMENVINFGLNLKVSQSTIVGFERRYNGNMRDCLREILNERLKQEPPLTWHDIVTALRSPSVCEDRLARQIESQYMTHSQHVSSVPQQQGIQLFLVPQHQGTQPSVPQQQGTQLSSVPQQEGTQPSVPQQEGNQLPQPERHKSSATHTSAVPSLQPSLSDNSAPPQASLGQSMRQPLILPHNFWGHLFYHQPASHDPLQPPNPPPHPSYFTPTQYPPFTPSPFGQLQSQLYLSQLYQSPYQPMGYLNNMFPIPHPFLSPTATDYHNYVPPQLPGISLSQNPVVSSQHDGNSSTRSESGSTYSVPSGSTHCGDGNNFIHSGSGDGRSHGGADSSMHSGSGSIHSGSSGSTHGGNDSSIQSCSGSSGSTHNVNSPVHCNSDSMLEENGPPAKRTRREPSVRPLSHNTTAVLTDDSSDSRQLTPTHTSVTPPLQSHSQSSGSDHPQTTTAVSESLVHHQSRIVEDVINRHATDLTSTIGKSLIYFSNKFIELGFMSRNASDNILTKNGIGNGEKSSQLLSLVIDHIHRSRYKTIWFDNFVGLFSSEAAYEDLATSMIVDFKNSISHTPSSPSTSHTPQLSPHVRSFIDYVKTVYRESEVERQTSVVKWPPTPSKVYINLVCIDRHSVRGRSRKYAEVTEAMVRDGNVDAIENVTKGPIDFSEIAKNISLPNSRETATSDEKKGNNRRLILVEGAPGVGKSTFAWEFCRRWERGEIAQQYQLVLLLRLREERISNAKSLENLIYHPFKDVAQGVCHELVHSHDFHALIILEGFDELPDRYRSVFMDLVAGKLLPLATVLVTSRPWATERIRLNHEDRIYQHIEILGFTGRQITEYIDSTLPQDKVSDLKAYLESHPQIRAGMYIPLNSAIVVTVYEESQASGCAMPTTLTELYTSLTLTLLVRYLRGLPEYETGCNYLPTFKDLHQPIYTKFCEVCKLAYSGIIGSGYRVQLIFRDLPSDFDDLGFMDSVTELYVTRGVVSSHNFLHLTFQEFFAAVHISSMSPEEQVEHFKRHKEGRLKVVLRFLAGLNKLNCFSQEETVKSFFQIPSVSEYKGTLISRDAAVGVDLVQWLFEAQSDDVLEHVLGQKTIEFDLSSEMLPMDYFCLGYCISHSQCQWVFGLIKSTVSEKKVRMIAAGARTGPGGRIVGLRIFQRHYITTESNQSLMRVAKSYNVVFTLLKSLVCQQQLSVELPVSCDQITWPDLSALQQLELIISGKTNWKLNTLLHHLSLESLIVAPAINIPSELVHEDCVAIGDHITSTTSLKELCISSNTTCISSDKGVEAITAALASNQSLPLERLELECECTFTATAGDSLAQFITNTTTLKYLSIKRCTFSAHALLVLARAIHHNSILQTKNVEEFSLTVNGDSEVKDLVQLLVKYPDQDRSL